jgi:hypothetical protein
MIVTVHPEIIRELARTVVVPVAETGKKRIRIQTGIYLTLKALSLRLLALDKHKRPDILLQMRLGGVAER